jgi:hypothetical protein
MRLGKTFNGAIIKLIEDSSEMETEYILETKRM